MSICPRCRGKQSCPCPSCAALRATDVTVWKWNEAGEFISCGYCGLTMHAIEWMDEKYRQFKVLSMAARKDV